jgi:hypothetical protein
MRPAVPAPDNKPQAALVRVDDERADRVDENFVLVGAEETWTPPSRIHPWTVQPCWISSNVLTRDTTVEDLPQIDIIRHANQPRHGVLPNLRSSKPIQTRRIGNRAFRI